MTTTRRHRSKRVTAGLVLPLLLAGTVGCSDDSDDNTAAGAQSSTTMHAINAKSATIGITAVDFEFDDLPTEVQAGATLTLRNESAGEVHELVAMRLADDEDRTAADLVALPEQELRALFAGPPALVLVAPPDRDDFVAVGDGTLSERGRYLLMCFIPTGAEPDAYLDALEANPGQPPTVPGGPPHFTAGMYGELTVR